MIRLVMRQGSRSNKCHIKRKKTPVSLCNRSMTPITEVWSGDRITFENLKEEYDVCQNCFKRYKPRQVI